jgi:D-lactate dehydrogenase (cytochrome)
MPSTPSAFGALKDLLGTRASDALAIRDHHSHGESYHLHALPDIVCFPRTTDEVVAIVKIAAAARLAIVPFGAGTSLEGHVNAIHGGITVDLREMNAITRVSVDDLDVTVEAGVTRLQLNKALNNTGLTFPIDPGADATLGGMVSTGASGTTTVRYGAMRENVLSLVVVTADGEIVRTRSRARKSSAGYDLTRLFVGSEGTLGLITEATLRLQPTPEAMTAATCAFPELGDAVDCVIEVLANGIPVARIELLDDVQMDAINRHAGLDQEVAPTLFLEFHGTPGEVEAQAADVGQIADAHRGHGFAWAADESQRRALWRARHRAYDAARALRPGARGFTTDACVPISRLAECITETKRDVEQSGLIAPIVGHVGDGNFHLAILVDPDDPEELDRAKALNDRLVRRAIAMDGTCTGEHGVGYGKAAFLELEHGPAALDMMRAVKRALDPDGLFNPGKIVR